MTSLVPYGDSDEDDDEASTLENGEPASKGVVKRRKLEAFRGSDVDTSDKKSKVHTSLGISASNPLKGDWVCYCFIPGD